MIFLEPDAARRSPRMCLMSVPFSEHRSSGGRQISSLLQAKTAARIRRREMGQCVSIAALRPPNKAGFLPKAHGNTALLHGGDQGDGTAPAMHVPSGLRSP
jgi:hypothetical protein